MGGHHLIVPVVPALWFLMFLVFLLVSGVTRIEDHQTRAYSSDLGLAGALALVGAAS